MSGFLGRYDFQMDEKGRVSLPAAFRREVEEDRFVLLQWEKPSLSLFPLRAWKTVQERLLEFRRSDPGAWAYVRRIASSAVEVSPDKQGRILIPGWLQEAAGLEGTVTLSGAFDRVEIWNPTDFEKAIAQEAEDAARFRHAIFG